jgi:hypothetical protein
VFRDELVKELGPHDLQARLKQLSPDHQGHHTTDHQVSHREQQIERPDILVIRRKYPSAPPDWNSMRAVVIDDSIGRVRISANVITDSG